MTTESLRIKTHNGVTTLTLNRPEKRNALDGPLIKALLHALQCHATNKQTRILLINGEGEHFCAGADIAWMQKMTTLSYDENYEDAQLLADLMYQLYTFPKPTLVLAHGNLFGGGLGLVAACDIAVATDDASFCFSEVKIGLAPSTISPYIMAAMGERFAHYYFLTGERFGAQEAHRIGLVHRVAARDDLPGVIATIVEALLQNSPEALQSVKQLIRYVSKEKITELLAQKTAEHLTNLRMSADAKEGLQSFLEKRSPQWIDVNR